MLRKEYFSIILWPWFTNFIILPFSRESSCLRSSFDWRTTILNLLLECSHGTTLKYEYSSTESKTPLVQVNRHVVSIRYKCVCWHLSGCKCLAYLQIGDIMILTCPSLGEQTNGSVAQVCKTTVVRVHSLLISCSSFVHHGRRYFSILLRDLVFWSGQKAMETRQIGKQILAKLKPKVDLIRILL